MRKTEKKKRGKPATKPTAPASPKAADLRANGTPRQGMGGPYPDRLRIAEVERLFSLRYSDTEIQRRVSADERFGCPDERTVRSDLRRIYADLRERSAANREDRVARALHTAERMFRSSLADGDRKVADRYFDKICRIEGAYAPDAVKMLGGEVEGLQLLSAEDLAREIAVETKKLLAMLPEDKRAAVVRSALELAEGLEAEEG